MLPMINSHMDIILALPEKIDINGSQMINFMRNNYHKTDSLNVSSCSYLGEHKLLSMYLKDISFDLEKFNQIDKKLISSLYEKTLVNTTLKLSSDDLILSFHKKSFNIDDEFHLKTVNNEFLMGGLNDVKVHLKLNKELASILGVQDLSNVNRRLVNSIGMLQAEIISQNKWNIRNMDLLRLFQTWIHRVVNHGDTKALINITKLKCMTYNKQPIYSMEYLT